MIVATIWKDIWLLLRDRGRLISLFALPVVFIIVFGSMFSGGPDRGKPRPIAVWSATGDANGRAILERLDGRDGFIAQPVDSADAVRTSVAKDSTIAGIIVPADFDPLRGHPVELVIDLAKPIQVRGPLEGALTALITRAVAPTPATMQPPAVTTISPPGIAKPLDNIDGFQVTVPGNAVLFGFFIAMTVAMSFASERHSGTWRRLLAAPIPRWKALLGKLVPYYLVGCVQLVFLFGLGAGMFHMQVAGSIVALVVLSLALVLCAMTFGLLVASFGGTEKQIGSIVPVVLLVMGLVGGCMFPRMLMPEVMREVSHVVPHSWALDGYYDLLVRQGTSLADVAPSIGALVAFSAVFAGFGLWRFRFE